MKKSTITLIILDVLAVACFLLAYGPNDWFKTYFITTAMHTKSHRYLAKILYSDEEISKVMQSNQTIVVSEVTDTSLINFDINNDSSDVVYDNIYEEQILTRGPENDVYKIIEFDGNGYHAYLTVVYDPSRVMTTKSAYYGTRGQYLSVMGEQANALIAVNGGAFLDPEGQSVGARAAGIFISNGEIIESGGGAVIGMTKDNVLTLGYMSAQEAINMGIRDAVYFGPFLIVNGKASQIVGNGGYGIDPRTAIAQRRDGIILFLTIDGSGNKYGFRGGASMGEVISILERYGAYNAANLDGGASTVLAVNGKPYNKPVAYSSSGERWLPNAWIVK